MIYVSDFSCNTFTTIMSATYHEMIKLHFQFQLSLLTSLFIQDNYIIKTKNLVNDAADIYQEMKNTLMLKIFIANYANTSKE